MKKRFLSNLFVLLLSISAAHSEEVQPEPQFSYQHKTAVAFNDKKSFELAPQVEHIAKKLNGYLDKSLFFNTEFVKDAEKVRKYHVKKKYDKGNVGKLYEVTTKDGLDLECTYFDRGSNTLAIIGSGFTNPREYLTPFVDMVDCDVVLFDFRGHGFKEFDLLSPKTWNLNLAKKTFGINSKHTTLGLKEERDVFAVVEGFKQLKDYKQVVGISVCYGALIFLKAQAMRPGTFDKLVLDGCWLSLESVTDKIKEDFKIICDPQRGGYSKTWPLNTSWGKRTIEWLVYNVWRLPVYNKVELMPYLPDVKDTPLMFFYGKDDLMVSREEFETIFNAVTDSPKTAVVTSNPHVRNHFKQKELYKLLVDLFIKFDPQEFETLIRDEQKLTNYQIATFTQSLKM